MTIPLYRRLGKTLGNKDWGQNSDIIQSYVFLDLDATASSDANQLNVYYKRFPVSTQTSATGAGERFVSEIKYRNIRYCLAFSSHITSTAVFFTEIQNFYCHMLNVDFVFIRTDYMYCSGEDLAQWNVWLLRQNLNN